MWQARTNAVKKYYLIILKELYDWAWHVGVVAWCVTPPDIQSRALRKMVAGLGIVHNVDCLKNKDIFDFSTHYK